MGLVDVIIGGGEIVGVVDVVVIGGGEMVGVVDLG